MGFRPIFTFTIVDVNAKRVVPIGVNREPAKDWTAQQLREVTPFGKGPQVLIRVGEENDHVRGYRNDHCIPVLNGLYLDYEKAMVLFMP